LFSRANLVVVVKKAGRVDMDIIEAATSIDREVIRKPEQDLVAPEEETRDVSAVRRPLKVKVAKAVVSVGVAVPLDIEFPGDVAAHATRVAPEGGIVAQAEELGATVKFFSSTGTFHREREQMFYTPARAGRQEIRISAEGAASRTRMHALKFSARDNA
jgi:hypothetical protein